MTPDGSTDTRGATNDEPLYNIGIVARMTGVPVATLRAWERRYDFPRSVRTPGGHRIYSEREADRVRWVKSRIDEGMQAGQAVHALAYLEQHAGAGTSTHPPPLPRTEAKRAPSATLAVTQSRFGAAVRAHDLAEADQILAETLVLFPLESVILEVILPTLNALGLGWADGDVSVATEHLASYYIRQRLLMWLAAGPPARPVAPVVLACAPGDWHETGLLMLGVLARRERWPVTYLGPSVPLADLAAFVRQARPNVVVLVATIEESARALAAWPDRIPEAGAAGRPVVCYGGRAFSAWPALREGMRGVYLGDAMEDGLATLTRVLREVTGDRS